MIRTKVSYDLEKKLYDSNQACMLFESHFMNQLLAHDSNQDFLSSESNQLWKKKNSMIQLKAFHDLNHVGHNLLIQVTN